MIPVRNCSVKIFKQVRTQAVYRFINDILNISYKWTTDFAAYCCDLSYQGRDICNSTDSAANNTLDNIFGIKQELHQNFVFEESLHINKPILLRVFFWLETQHSKNSHCRVISEGYMKISLYKEFSFFCYEF